MVYKCKKSAKSIKIASKLMKELTQDHARRIESYRLEYIACLSLVYEYYTMLTRS